MKKLNKKLTIKKLQRLDELSRQEINNIKGGVLYGGVDISITGKPTIDLPPFTNPSVSVTYTF